MVKVKFCLDTDCTRFIYLEDTRTIEVPKERCDVNPKAWGKPELEKWSEITRGADVIRVSGPSKELQHVKKGDNVTI